MKNSLHKICVSILLPLLLCMTVLFSFAGSGRAAGGVTVNLAFREASAQAGDIVHLDVSFTSFPSITRFGPIEIGYDKDVMEFQGIESGPTMEGYSFSYHDDPDSSIMSISAINEEVEAQIIQEATGENAKDPTARALNRVPVYSSETPVVVATLKFQIHEQAGGEIKAWLGSLSGLRDSSLESVVAGSGTGASLVVQAKISSDATLSSLSVGSFELDPEFDPGIFSYNVIVSKNTTDVAVNGVAFNLKSKVDVEGGSDLQIGNNAVLVRVTAEDGEKTNTYTINIYRSDSLLVEGISIQDSQGISYDFVPFPETLVIPSGFYQSSCVVDGKEVPCFRKDGVLSVLIYVQEGETEPGLYVYNQETDSMRRFEPGRMLLRSSLILTVAEKPVDVLVPEGFTPAKITYGNTEIDGYVSKDGATKIAYLKTEDGKARFYVIDSTGKDFYPYRAPKSTGNLFLYLFIVCASIAVAEALIIGILFYRRRIAYRRQVKPRRV